MRVKEKTSRIIAFSLLILVFLATNWLGDHVVSRMNWPIWLDSVGTVLCAYQFGPVCGAIVGATFNLLGWVIYDYSWLYAIVSVVIATVVGIAAKRKKLNTLLDTLTTSAILAGITTLTAYPINLLTSGSTGNSWGDAVIGFLRERGIPAWAGLLVGELYVELLDKLVILTTMFFIIRLIRFALKFFRSRVHSDKDTGDKPVRIASLLLAVLLGASACGGWIHSGQAEEKKSDSINYSDYVKTIFSTSSGLLCGEANDIAMTGDGILWIGTYAGLYRYNGREFKQMNDFESVRNVNCLYVDEQGRLWIGTNDSGLSIMINEQIVNIIDKDRGLPSNTVTSIIKSADGYYYIGTANGMMVLTLNTGLQRIGILSEIIKADNIAADNSGIVAAITEAGTLFIIREGKIILSRRMTEISADYRSCTFEQDGSILIGTTGNTIYHYRIDGNGLTELDHFACKGLTTIKTLRRMDNGELFICADNGIAHIDNNGEYEKITTGDFNNSIDNMLVDYQGNLWFTSSRLGLLRLAPSDFRDIYNTAQLPNQVVNTVVMWQPEGGDPVYYFGTDNGLDAVDYSGKEKISDSLTESLAGGRIRCMIVDSKNHLWICNSRKGLLEVEPEESGEQILYDESNGALDNKPRVAVELSDGTIAFGGDKGTSFIRDQQVTDTVSSVRVMTFLEMPDKTLLAGTDGTGILILREETTENGEYDWAVKDTLTKADGLSSEVILRMIADPGQSGAVFIVTSNGLCYMDPQGKVRALNNFPYFNNYNIWTKDDKTLFVLSSAGIYVVNRDELSENRANMNCELLDVRRGLNSSLTANSWTWFNPEENELYLPCDTGVFVLDTESFSGAAKFYRMNVSGIKAGDTMYRVERGTTTQIPRESSRIEILPEVINYSVQDPNVGYMLEGFDEKWTIVPQNALGSIVYSNLPVGDYVFHLAVFDNNQQNILSERVYSISREKEMYDNNWFIFYILSVPMFTVFWVTWLLLKRHELKVQAELAEANRQVEMGKQTVAAIAKAVDAKDERTGGHSTRVAMYSGQIAHAYGLDDKQCREIEWAAQLHDIGKIAIPDAILNKDSRLTDAEYATMKSHTTRGAEILKDFTLLDHVTEGAQYHHERPDGKGYPKGLKGEEIPLYARIIGVADAFDAMTATRVYRKQMDFGYVLGELEKGRGTQFASEFVDILLNLIRTNVIDLNKLYGIKPEDTATKAEEKPETPTQGKEG